MRRTDIKLAVGQEISIPSDGYFVYLKSSSGAVKFSANNEVEIKIDVGDKFIFDKVVKSIRLINTSGTVNTLSIIHGSGDFLRLP